MEVENVKIIICVNGGWIYYTNSLLK